MNTVPLYITIFLCLCFGIILLLAVIKEVELRHKEGSKKARWTYVILGLMLVVTIALVIARQL